MEKQTNVIDSIVDHLEDIERPMTWLSEKTEIPYPTIYALLKQRAFALSEKNLEKINKALNTNFINQ